jgi:hypothetical protein
MDITLLATTLAFSAPAATTEIPGTLRRVNLAGRGGIRLLATIASAGKAGATMAAQYSVDGVTWFTLTPAFTVDATGAKGTSRPNGNIDYEAVPPGAQGDVLVRAVATGGGSGVTGITLTYVGIEVL